MDNKRVHFTLLFQTLWYDLPHSPFVFCYKARVSLYESGNVVKELFFNAAASQYSNWFEKARLKSSPWSDIWTEPQNYFSVNGHCGRRGPNQCRYFYINRNFGGCNVDRGWLMYTTHNACGFESGQRYSTVQYSKFSGSTRMDDYGK